MNIQQLRYVVAIANSGTFREAAEKMYVSQPSLSISVRDLEKSSDSRFSAEPVLELSLLVEVWNFMKRHKSWSKDLMFFRTSMPILKRKRMSFQ